MKDYQIKNVISMLSEGATIPFMARYRKEVTGGLSDEQLRTLGERLTYLRNLETRKGEIIKSIDEQGKLTDELTIAIASAETLAEVEDLYRPFKQKKKTRATVAKAKGLEPLADIIIAQEEKKDINEIAQEFVNIDNLSDEDINKFSILNKNLEKINQDYKILVDQGKMKTFAYSKLVDELNGLSLKLSRLQDDLDFQLRSITSMKDDETRAREQLATIENLLKKAKYRLKDYKIPVIPSSYYIELTEAQDAIREIIKELDRKPIVIKILNIRVDTARDLVFKIYNKTNDMIKIASMSEKIIIYGNRYRSSYEEIDIALTKAEELFKRGKYKESLDLSMKSLSFIDKNVTEKF